MQFLKNDVLNEISFTVLLPFSFEKCFDFPPESYGGKNDLFQETKRDMGSVRHQKKALSAPPGPLIPRPTPGPSVIESEMARCIFISRQESEKTTLSEVLDRYEKEVSSSKKRLQPGTKTDQPMETASSGRLISCHDPGCLLSNTGMRKFPKDLQPTPPG